MQLLAKIEYKPPTTVAINPTSKLAPNNSPTLVSFTTPTTHTDKLVNPYTGGYHSPLANDCAADLATLLSISYKAAAFILNSQYEESQRLSNTPKQDPHYKLVTGNPINYALHYMTHCPALFTATHLISAERIMQLTHPTPQDSTGFSPLTCNCHSCGATFKILRTDPDLYRYTPQFCIFCGAPNLNVSPASTEDTAFASLAAHYGMAQPIIEMIYAQWSSANMPNYPTFASYVEAFRNSNKANG